MKAELKRRVDKAIQFALDNGFKFHIDGDKTPCLIKMSYNHCECCNRLDAFFRLWKEYDDEISNYRVYIQWIDHVHEMGDEEEFDLRTFKSVIKGIVK
jgi:hypothetical protein